MTEPHSGRNSASREEAPRSATSSVDSRVVDAWCAWLDALATDAEAALAASMAYEELDGPARDTWLKALDQDSARVGVPRIAMYAPLLAVETDPGRRKRITAAMGSTDATAAPQQSAWGFRGKTSGGLFVAALVSPLYLEFVQVLACGYHVQQGFEWVRHDPILSAKQAPRANDEIEGAIIEPVPLQSLVDELALTVLAHQRGGRSLPDALRVFADLFGPSGTPPVP